MPLRMVRIPQVSCKTDALRITLTMSMLANELSNISVFPPVVAATSILLIILQTVQNNREACANLAERCAQMLLDLNDIMRDKWETAPPALLRNLTKYTETLGQSGEKRLFRKASIEAALADFDKKLGDSAQMFQMAMLIDISHHVLSRKTITDVSPKQDVDLEPPPAYQSKQNTLDEQSTASPQYDKENVQDDTSNVTLRIEDSEDADEVLISDTVLEDHGFRRYHQSQSKAGGLADVAVGEVDGQNSKNDAIKTWLHDVKNLQNLFHPNLPHMTGYSDEHSPTPFILLSDVRTNAADKIMSQTLRNEGVAACINLLARYYNDITDATAYIQRQLNMPDNHLQDFVEKTSYRVGASNTIVMGLPPAREGTWVSYRNYDLSHSLARAICFRDGGTVQRRLEHYQATDEDPLKVAHLVSLAKCLLSNTHCSTSPLITKLLQDKDDEFEDFSEGPKISMKELRQHSLKAGVHDFFWTEMSAIPAHKFAVGDFGYVPSNTAFGDFVKLGNIYSDNLANLPITARTYGSQFCWEDRPVQHVEIQKYPLPLDVYGWPIAVPRGSQIDSWGFLSNHAKQLAGKFNVAPEDLILIIAAGTNQNFYIRDFGNYFMNHTSISIPTIMYLLTSPPINPIIGYCHGFIQWIRLLKEDFLD
ncbi:hypothetical protein F5887DRAFT_976082 [Amanita rubescens]|nr:hypothetical protein F5887DRAFT_976082 [Amanita rubescens]